MSINYDYYRTFYFVAKYGNLTIAARQMGASQPNITRVIKLLEAQIGNTLFTRSKTGMRLTPEGQKLYSRIRPAVERIADAEYELKANVSLKNGLVSLGVTEIALRCFLLPILGNFHRSHPGVRFKIYNHSTQESIEAMKAGLVDMAVVTSPFPHDDNSSIRVLKRIQERPICGSKFSFLPKHPVSLKDLLKFPLISLGAGSASQAFYVELFAAYNLSFSPDIEAATADQIIPLFRENLGIGFVPEDFLKEAGKDLQPLSIIEEIPKRSICCVIHKALPLNPAARHLYEEINAAAEQYDEAKDETHDSR